MGDVGQALGAALSTYSKYNSNLKPFKLDNVYFGPEFTEEEIEKELNKNNLEFTKEEDISKSVANLLAQNKVIAFFQGRMEYGPRALGNRSILYPATDPKVNNWLNKRLGRTEFMPFAPVTLLERASDCYLEEDLKKSYYTSQFMTIALHVTDYMKNNMPAAVHIDGTARPQLISEENNKVYYQVLKEYENKTGLPSLINTSFNMHGEPIVCSPKEAIKAFLLSSLDALAIGNYLVKKA